MRFKSFKGLTLGRSKERTLEDPAPVSPAVNEKEEPDRKIEKLPEAGDEESGPHGPLGELSIEPEDQTDDDVPEIVLPEQEAESHEEIKIVDITAEKGPVPAAAEAGGVDLGDSLNSLFSNDEEEVNPLANLISSLPDYTTKEIIEDLNEIKTIIREWQRD
jgi:hypothetical protein